MELKKWTGYNTMGRGSSKAGKNKNTNHMGERKKERNVSDDDVRDALYNPIHKGDVKTDQYGRRSQQIIWKNATVVINPDTGARITTWKTGQQRRRKYGGDNAGK